MITPMTPNTMLWLSEADRPRRHPYQVTPPSKPARRAVPRRSIDLSSSSRASDSRSLVSSPKVPGAQMTRRGILQCPSRRPTSTPCRFSRVSERATEIGRPSSRRDCRVCRWFPSDASFTFYAGVLARSLAHRQCASKPDCMWLHCIALHAPKLVLQARNSPKHSTKR